MEFNIVVDMYAAEEGRKEKHLIQGKTQLAFVSVLMLIGGLMSSAVCQASYGFANWQENAAGGLCTV